MPEPYSARRHDSTGWTWAVPTRVGRPTGDSSCGTFANSAGATGAAHRLRPQSARRGAPARCPAALLAFRRGLPPRRLLLLSCRVRTGPAPVDELDQRDGRSVAKACAELHDARVAARPGRVPRPQLREQLAHHARPLHQPRRPAAGVQRPRLAERDQPVTPALEL